MIIGFDYLVSILQDIPKPTDGYTEWGYLGGLIFLVVAFLVYLWRRDRAAAQEEKDRQQFYSGLMRRSETTTAELTSVVKELIQEFREHDTTTKEAIATMKERTAPRAPKGRTQE
jgi:C4-dicarboxylate-specific signal transduction histidine kinase